MVAKLESGFQDRSQGGLPEGETEESKSNHPVPGRLVGAFQPPSSRAEGLLFLHGLESNPGSSLQTEEEAGLP